MPSVTIHSSRLSAILVNRLVLNIRLVNKTDGIGMIGNLSPWYSMRRLFILSRYERSQGQILPGMQFTPNPNYLDPNLHDMEMNQVEI